jgi:hypothetical protein
MQKWLGQSGETGNSHLCQGEGVHPEDMTDAPLRVVCLATERTDLFCCGQDRLKDDAARNKLFGIE